MPEDKTVEYATADYGQVDRSETSPCLVVLSGPEAGAVICLKQGETVVGRCPEKAEVVLSEPGISRRHACFTVDGGVVTVRDMGSTNGLKVNGEKAEEAVLEPGDSVALSAGLSLRVSRQDQQIARLMAFLYRQATLDTSGVLSRQSFFARVSVQGETSLGVVEVDSLERVRDRFGPIAEEQLVGQVAEILKNALAGKGFVGRLSGESFVVLLHCRALDADEVLEGARKGIECTNFRVDTGAGTEFLRATISGGFANLDDPEAVDRTLSEAGKALLSAKQMGRNRIVGDR